MSNKNREINVSPDENTCPGDVLMADFRRKVKNAPKNSYSKRITISETSVKFWQEHADIIEENDDNITFYWDEIQEQELPPLKIKVRRGNGNYTLSYLKEYGEDELLIKGKQRKGKNKNGKIFLNKEEEKGEER